MGAVAFTYTTPLRRISRHLVERAGTVTPSSSYASGGDTGFNPVIGKTCLAMYVEPKGGYVFVYDSANNKLLAYVSGTTDAPLNEEGAADIGAAVGAVRWRSLGTK